MTVVRRRRFSVVEFTRRLRADAIAHLERTEVASRLLPESVREAVMGKRLATLRDMVRQYDEYLADKAKH